MSKFRVRAGINTNCFAVKLVPVADNGILEMPDGYPTSNGGSMHWNSASPHDPRQWIVKLVGIQIRSTINTIRCPSSMQQARLNSDVLVDQNAMGSRVKAFQEPQVQSRLRGWI